MTLDDDVRAPMLSSTMSIDRMSEQNLIWWVFLCRSDIDGRLTSSLLLVFVPTNDFFFIRNERIDVTLHINSSINNSTMKKKLSVRETRRPTIHFFRRVRKTFRIDEIRKSTHFFRLISVETLSVSWMSLFVRLNVATINRWRRTFVSIEWRRSLIGRFDNDEKNSSKQMKVNLLRLTDVSSLWKKFAPPTNDLSTSRHLCPFLPLRLFVGLCFPQSLQMNRCLFLSFKVEFLSKRAEFSARPRAKWPTFFVSNGGDLLRTRKTKTRRSNVHKSLLKTIPCRTLL